MSYTAITTFRTHLIAELNRINNYGGSHLLSAMFQSMSHRNIGLIVLYLLGTDQFFACICNFPHIRPVVGRFRNILRDENLDEMFRLGGRSWRGFLSTGYCGCIRCHIPKVITMFQAESWATLHFIRTIALHMTCRMLSIWVSRDDLLSIVPVWQLQPSALFIPLSALRSFGVNRWLLPIFQFMVKGKRDWVGTGRIHYLVQYAEWASTQKPNFFLFRLLWCSQHLTIFFNHLCVHRSLCTIPLHWIYSIVQYKSALLSGKDKHVIVKYTSK